MVNRNTARGDDWRAISLVDRRAIILELQEGVAFGRELILRGSEKRLAPILMTALATGLALVPIVLGGTRAGYERSIRSQ
jgi:multidrug efflux pump subunit AcrB